LNPVRRTRKSECRYEKPKRPEDRGRQETSEFGPRARIGSTVAAAMSLAFGGAWADRISG